MIELDVLNARYGEVVVVDEPGGGVTTTVAGPG
jgi:hypothetical protein